MWWTKELPPYLLRSQKIYQMILICRKHPPNPIFLISCLSLSCNSTFRPSTWLHTFYTLKHELPSFVFVSVVQRTPFLRPTHTLKLHISRSTLIYSVLIHVYPACFFLSSCAIHYSFCFFFFSFRSIDVFVRLSWFYFPRAYFKELLQTLQELKKF